MLKLEFSNKTRKFLQKTDSKTWNRVIKKIKKLREEPFPNDSKRVTGRKEKTFRVRVGSYRILYVVFFDKNLIFISKIDKRPKVYFLQILHKA